MTFTPAVREDIQGTNIPISSQVRTPSTDGKPGSIPGWGTNKIDNDMLNIESRIQQGCVRWFRLQYPKYAGLLYAIPNGGYRNAVTGAILKAEGALAGVADLFLSVPNRYYHGFYIEMKKPKGRQQESQKAFQKAVEEQSYKYSLCYSLDEFMQLINGYLKEV